MVMRGHGRCCPRQVSESVADSSVSRLARGCQAAQPTAPARGRPAGRPGSNFRTHGQLAAGRRRRADDRASRRPLGQDGRAATRCNARSQGSPPAAAPSHQEPSAMNAPVDFNALKTRQQTAWASGDYAVIGTTLQTGGRAAGRGLRPALRRAGARRGRRQRQRHAGGRAPRLPGHVDRLRRRACSNTAPSAPAPTAWR